MSLAQKVSGAKVSFAIFKRDIKRLLVNPVAIVVTIGVCAIPSLYAWYNIVANWDPYGNTQSIKIAVANNDAGTENDLTGSLNAGKQVVKQLKKNHQLGWTFVDSAEDAKEGVESGEYYAAIVIPKSFSEDLTSMLSGTFHQPKLTYYVNEKKSAIAPKVTDTGASTIEKTINETFVSTVSKTLVKTAKKAGLDVSDATGEAQTNLSSSVSEASDSLARVRSTLDGMNASIDATKQAIASTDATLAGLQDQIPSLTKAISQTNDVLSSARTTTSGLSTSLNSALSNGSSLMGKTSVKVNTAVGKLSGAISSASAKITTATDAIDSAMQNNSTIIKELNSFIDTATAQGLSAHGIELAKQVVSKLESQNMQLATIKKGLQDQQSAINGDADAMSSSSDAVNSAVQNGVSTLSDAQSNLNSNVVPQLSSGLDSFASMSGNLSSIVSGLTPTIANARGLMGQLSSTLDQAKTSLSTMDKQLEKIQTKLSKASTDIQALQTSEAMDQISELMGVSVHDVADFMASPVKLTSKSLYSVNSFGSGIAPFYTNLALWVGGYVLIAIIKLEVDREGIGSFTAKQAYFGRWLLLVLLGAIQALIVCAGDLVIGVQCVNPVGFIFAGVCISFVYVNIIYALSCAFKHIGKAVGVILVIVQIPGSSGMYPIEMMPGFFQALHPFLPFTYGINAMRECIGGAYGLNYLYNLGALALFVVVALIIGVWLRPFLLNLNLLFDRELATTGVMICEKNNMARHRFSLRAAMRSILDVEAYRSDLLKRAEVFEYRYPTYIRCGFITIFGVQILLFILTSTLDLDIDGKIVMLVLWILSVIAVAVWLINIEYIRDTLDTQIRLSALSDENLRDEIRRRTNAIPAAARLLGLNPREMGDAFDADAKDDSAGQDKLSKGGEA